MESAGKRRRLPPGSSYDASIRQIRKKQEMARLRRVLGDLNREHFFLQEEIARLADPRPHSIAARAQHQRLTGELLPDDNGERLNWIQLMRAKSDELYRRYHENQLQESTAMREFGRMQYATFLSK